MMGLRARACTADGDKELTKIEAMEKGRLKAEAEANCKTRPNIKVRENESIIVSSLDWIGKNIEGLTEWG